MSLTEKTGQSQKMGVGRLSSNYCHFIGYGTYKNGRPSFMVNRFLVYEISTPPQTWLQKAHKMNEKDVNFDVLQNQQYETEKVHLIISYY